MERTIVEVKIVGGPAPEADIEGEWDVSGFGYFFGKEAVGNMNLKRVVRWDEGSEDEVAASLASILQDDPFDDDE